MSNLERARREAGLSQQALAAKSGIPQPKISYLENYERKLPILAKALGVPVESLR